MGMMLSDFVYNSLTIAPGASPAAVVCDSQGRIESRNSEAPAARERS